MVTDNGPRYGQWTLWPNRLRARGERESVFKVISPDFERYGQWETERVCVCSKDHNPWFFAGSFRKVTKYSRILLFCLFCQKGGPARGDRVGGVAWARGGTGGEGLGGGARRVHTHTCALGTGHTLVYLYNKPGWSSFSIRSSRRASVPPFI